MEGPTGRGIPVDTGPSGGTPDIGPIPPIGVGGVTPTFREAWKACNLACISFGIPPENVFVGGLRAALRETRGAGNGLAGSDNERSDGTARGIPLREDEGVLRSSATIGNSGCDEPGGSDIAEGCLVFRQS